MALEVKDIIESLGIEIDLATAKVEDFKKKIDERFITLEDAHTNPDIIKKANGNFGFEVDDTIYKSFKDLGIEKAELKTIPTTKEKIQFIAQKAFDTVKELKEHAGKGNDEKVIKLQKDLEKIQGQAGQYKTELEKTAGELEKTKSEFTSQLKGFKVNSIMKDAKGKLAWSDQVNEITKLGFDVKLSEKYVLDLDENDNPVLMDKKGQKIPHPKKTGTFLTIDEVLDMELDAAGLKKKNNLDGKTTFTSGKQTQQATVSKPRFIAPAAVNNVSN